LDGAEFCRIQPTVQTSLHQITAFSDHCRTFWRVADLNRLMKLRKLVKSSLIRSRRNGTSTRSDNWRTDGKKW
jgi:hypothetical protein